MLSKQPGHSSPSSLLLAITLQIARYPFQMSNIRRHAKLAVVGGARRAVVPPSVPSAEDRLLHCCVLHLPAFRPVFPTPLPPTAKFPKFACV